ncbi:MAG: MarR family transcriptional regulator [Alphaproteobacteria bacterium]|jgi:DNA-binding MarR family transcriptional regulator|nr:MarR family transcriptional regulator [Alphaproteobacteria bacterium]
MIIPCTDQWAVHKICIGTTGAEPMLDDRLENRLRDFSLQDVPGHLIRLCQQRAVDLFVEEVGEQGPNPRQFAVLVNVLKTPGMSQTALVEASGIDRSTLTEVLKRMIDRDLISKSRTKEDQRANALFITERGRDMLSTALDAAERAQARILSPLPAKERDRAMTVLTRLSGHGE